MDNEDKTVLVNLWMEKSRNEFKSAKENLQTENFSTVINRSYYCVFYSIRALLTLHELKNKKHKSDIRSFHKLYIHTGIFPRELYPILLEMESQREKFDYNPVYPTLEEAQQQYVNAQTFLNAVEAYLNPQNP